MEEARLLDSLQRRLGDLEHKVRAYHHELVVDFQRYYHDVLRDVPPIVASNVRQSLVQSLPDYPLLSRDLGLVSDNTPDPDKLADTRAVAHSGSGQRHHSPPATVPVVGIGAAEPPGSPHEREKELQGLFTPAYLPLLESYPELPKSPPPAPVAHPLTPPPSTMLLPDPGIADLGQGTVMAERGEMPDATGSQDLPPATPQSPLPSPSRPGHVRRSTDDTTSSAVSDRSDTQTPRSALRRSSSTSKPPRSPRRVRFDFMGAEVLPTASPQPTDFMTHRISSPDDFVNSDSILGDDEDDQPPPRKISSSEALRALSRTAPEEGTVWTVVNSNNPDEILVEQDDSPEPTMTEPSANPPPFNLLPAAPDPPPSLRQAPGPTRTSPGSRLGRVREEPNEDVDNDGSSDEDFLSMAKPKSFTTKKTPNSPSPTKAPLIEPLPSSSTGAGEFSRSSKRSVDDRDSAATRNSSALDEDDDDDDMFHFETGLSAPPKPRSGYLPTKDDTEAEDEQEDEEDNADDTVKQSVYATSPAVAIARPTMSSPPTTPTTAKFQAGSLGSYKGRPVVMPVVRDPELHAQAASLGQFNTFVGGLDGRSGMDEGDLNSFRASFANTGFSGTPRSFTERLMMEEAQKHRSSSSDPPQ